MEIVASVDSQNILIWDISSGNIVATLEHLYGSCFCFSPCGSFLASSSSVDCDIVLWYCNTWTKLRTLTGQGGGLVSINFNSAGDRIVSTLRDHTVRVWSLVTNTDELTIEISECAQSASFNSDGSIIAVVADSRVNLYDSNTGELKQLLLGPSNLIGGVMSSHDGSMLVCGSISCQVILFDVASGTVLQAMQGHFFLFTEIRFNADDTKIVSASEDTTVRIWDVSTGECLLTLRGHEYGVSSCCFSNDGSKVITASDDGTIKVWDSNTGEELSTLRGHIIGVKSVRCQPSTIGSYI